MTVDHLPPSIADLAEPEEHAEGRASAGKVSGTTTRVEPTPEPTPEAVGETDDSWQQRSGFGSFP